MSSTELQELDRKRKDSSSSASSKHSKKDAIEPERYDDTDDPEVRFIQANNSSDVKLDVGAPKIEFTGLSKEEIMKFANDPFWKRVRLVLFILFWLLWAGMLVAAILIIVLTPKCPPIPKQTFWEKSSGYHLDVATFKDSDGDGVGDIKGVVENVDYLKNKCGFLVLSSVIQGSIGTSKVRSTAITDFMKVDNIIGTEDDVKLLMKTCRKKGLKVIIELPPHTGKDHEWFKKAAKGDKKYQKYYLWGSASAKSPLVNRVGAPVWNTEGSGVYWSSLHESVPALNLNNSEVLDHLSMATKFWLNQGFDGIFIDNAAFLAPEVETTEVGTGLTIPAGLPEIDLTKWYKTGHSGQLFTTGSIRFIQNVRKWVNEVQKKTDREQLLLVSSGDTGLVQNREKTLEYLSDGAHSVIVYDLVLSKGAKVVKDATSISLKERVNDILSINNSVTTVTQTLSGPRQADFATTSMNLLIPTTALTLYGEEVLMTGYGSELVAKKVSPGPAYWYLTQAAIKSDKYVDDFVDSYDVPMQWTRDGGFSSNNETSGRDFMDQNVMSLSTIGRGQTVLDVFEKLKVLRNEHSLNWGAMDWVDVEEKKKPNHYIFTREAKGFAKYVIVIIKGSMKPGGRARDLSKACEEGISVLSFPTNSDFKKDAKLSMSNIYLQFNKEGSLFVFKCV